MVDNLWYKNAVFYEVYVRAICDSNGDGCGDIKGLTTKLDYFRELGVDCLWLTPIYPSPLKDDGYDISDFYNIHPDYGTIEDFREFLKEAHARGLRVINDLVVNHTSDQHPWFQAAREDPKSPYHDYYVWSETGEEYSQARIIFLDIENSNWAWDEKAGKYYWHRFFTSQPDLNYDNPRVQQEMLDIVKFWLDQGLDGFRVDAVPYLFEREGTNCENLPETHAYLKQMRKFVDEYFPGRLLLCEANQWPADVRQYFGNGDEFHMGFNFPVMPRIYMALATSDRTPVVNIMATTPPIPENCQWCTFLRNHDELTLEMVTLEEREFMWETYAPEARMRHNLGIRRRLAPLLGGDRRKIELLNSILFTLPGSPILYYGDEIGMGDNIWLHDRNGVRTPMQWNDSLNAGFSSSNPDHLYNPVIDDEQFGYQKVNVAQQMADPNSLWHTIRRMIFLRKEQEAFRCDTYEFLPVANTAILAIARICEDHVIIALHNLCSDQVDVNLDLTRWTGSEVIELMSGQSWPSVTGNTYTVKMEPYGYVWLKFYK